MAVAAWQGAPAGGQGRGGRGQGGPAVAEIQQLKENLYLLTGGGGNTAAFVTDSGVVLVDTKLANWGQAILDKVRTVTDRPVTMIINTHTHGDHTGSNDFFGASVDIVAHANTKTNMERMPAFQGQGAAYLPKRTYTDRMTLGSGASQIDLYHFGPGHTNGDTFVVFRGPRVMHAGDMFPGKSTPFVDTNNGGSAMAFGKTLSGAAGVTGIDTVIPGHSTPMTPADLQEYASFMTDIAAWIEAQAKAGKTVDQAAAEFQIPARYQGYAVGNMGGGIRGIIQTAYTEMGR
jgi:glyoxylase-like metal-dependent hydrolase (beta-lactamase superfamily II)